MGGLGLIVLRTTALADLVSNFISNFLSYHTSIQSPPPWCSSNPTPALGACSVSPLCLELSSPTHELHVVLHYFPQTSARMPCSLTVLSWPYDSNLTPPHHTLSLLPCVTLFYVTYDHLRDITDLFTLCLLPLEHKSQESRDFLCSLLVPSGLYRARHNRKRVKLDGYLTLVMTAITEESTINKCHWGCGGREALTHCWVGM